MGYIKPLPSKIPFWSEVIIQHFNQVSLSAGGTYEYYLQPPSGETWLIYLSAVFIDYTNNSEVVYRDYDGSSYRTHYYFRISGEYNPKYPLLNVQKILTNSLYANVHVFNASGTTRYAHFGYSGFKLGTKKAEFQDIEIIKTKPYERATKHKIRSEFEGLEDMVRDVYFDDIDNYKQVIYFYKDKPIRKDRRTGHVIERASSYIETDVLLKNLEKIKTGELDLKRTGYKEWLDKIKRKKGIDLLGRL
ncbi:MAG: hypothetical protein DRO04_01805 [Candidatus Iainarchaeum archaeon]|uniref:Uncharacterized protein n=1 Tax=Candidatus Iainarchaeum sp. TaxID=3101447 RepID=A0A497JKL4_9ARCH|nr:MAG: hypothetical protein DRO04_01805 [Candidatus Diapherotrites archaeon]